MDVNRIVSELDAEITRLQKIRAALTSIGETKLTSAKGKPGRPKGQKNIATAAATTNAAVKSVTKKAKTKRKLTPEGRKRIAEAMKRRWATHRKNAQGK